MGDITWSSNVTTTWDVGPGKSALVRVQHDEGQFVVSDFLGLRYGAGDSLEGALTDWARGVREFVEWAEGQNLAPGLAAEVAAYRKFLAGGEK